MPGLRLLLLATQAAVYCMPSQVRQYQPKQYYFTINASCTHPWIAYLTLLLLPLLCYSLLVMTSNASTPMSPYLSIG
jgi:hypothetical protein